MKRIVKVCKIREDIQKIKITSKYFLKLITFQLNLKITEHFLINAAHNIMYREFI